jgi:hypothetical protein
MKTLLLYKVKGYKARKSLFFPESFKVLIAAHDFDEAVKFANEFVAPGGSIESVKETDKEVIIKGEDQNDQSE